MDTNAHFAINLFVYVKRCCLRVFDPGRRFGRDALVEAKSLFFMAVKSEGWFAAQIGANQSVFVFVKLKLGI